MKTALQEFIDNVIPMHIIELDMIKQEIKKALEKEKEQMLNEWQKGFNDAKFIYMPINLQQNK
jgi:hypothetical protein